MQILQTGNPSSDANLIGATEVADASFAECAILGAAIIANDVPNFGILAVFLLHQWLLQLGYFADGC